MRRLRKRIGSGIVAERPDDRAVFRRAIGIRVLVAAVIAIVPVVVPASRRGDEPVAVLAAPHRRGNGEPVVLARRLLRSGSMVAIACGSFCLLSCATSLANPAWSRSIFDGIRRCAEEARGARMATILANSRRGVRAGAASCRTMTRARAAAGSARVSNAAAVGS